MLSRPALGLDKYSTTQLFKDFGKFNQDQMRQFLNAYGNTSISPPVGECSLKNLSALSGNLLMASSREVIIASV